MMRVISFCVWKYLESMVMFAELYCLLTANNFIKVYIVPFVPPFLIWFCISVLSLTIGYLFLA